MHTSMYDDNCHQLVDSGLDGDQESFHELRERCLWLAARVRVPFKLKSSLLMVVVTKVEDSRTDKSQTGL